MDFKNSELPEHQDQNTPLSQPFKVPTDAQTRSDLKFDRCLYRFSGEAQVAMSDFTDPSMISAHIVIFDADTFGVLFLSLKSFSYFSRVTENLCAVDLSDI